MPNRVVMAPMTRCRAIDNTPNAMMAEYYAQRAGAGLIVTEGTSPSPNGLGYPRIPGAFSDAQMAGWKAVTTAVHDRGGRIFLQLMHSGRISHPVNMADDARILAPSAVTAAGEMFTDELGPQPHAEPQAMSLADIAGTQQEYADAAGNAIEAGFDGVELHGANGYLPEQFISPGTNQRSDEYGGSLENRCRFIIETATRIAAATGPGRCGVRLSPYGVFNDMPLYDDIDATYRHLATSFSPLKLAYLHVIDMSSQGAHEVPLALKREIKALFDGSLILNGGFDRDTAEAAIDAGNADLVSFGMPFVANPDLVTRMEHGLALTEADPDTLYSAGPEGYTDYARAAG
ncbi:MAG: alkene reductase [Gammaproteobacteria bacterium]|nr:alkene reductase [Gammaproteobacteria bacterium]